MRRFKLVQGGGKPYGINKEREALCDDGCGW